MPTHVIKKNHKIAPALNNVSCALLARDLFRTLGKPTKKKKKNPLLYLSSFWPCKERAGISWSFDALQKKKPAKKEEGDPLSKATAAPTLEHSIFLF